MNVCEYPLDPGRVCDVPPTVKHEGKWYCEEHYDWFVFKKHGWENLAKAKAQLPTNTIKP